MKKTHVFAIFIITALSISLIVPSAWAGSRHRRHRDMIRGAAIGIGAFMIGQAIHDRSHRDRSHRDRGRRRPAAYCPPVRQYAPSPPRQIGHWETHRVWVPPTYQRVWNPGHYNQRNCWVPGSWIQVVDQPGYWDEQQEWVAVR